MDDDFTAYVHEYEFAQGSQWGEVVLQLAVGTRDEGRYMRDSEAIRCAETGYSPRDIYLGARMWDDDQLGVMDGPLRYRPPREPVHTQAVERRTPKAMLTKRQRAKLRKERRAAKRLGVMFDDTAAALAALTHGR